MNVLFKAVMLTALTLGVVSFGLGVLTDSITVRDAISEIAFIILILAVMVKEKIE